MRRAHDFRGQTVVVSGAGRGIGLEIARYFVDAGTKTFLLDLDRTAVTEAAASLGAEGLVVDVARSDQVNAAIEHVVATTGGVDILVNNAGLLRDRVLWKLSDDDWDTVLSVHLGGTFRLTRACVPHFRASNRGRIVNVTSYTGLHGNPGQAAYAAAKAGIIGFTKTAAKELGRFGVTVNAISPNAETQMIASIPPDVYESIRQQIPLGRFGRPSEMCGAVGFLASEEAAYVTGVVLPVDGGLSM